MTIVLFKKLASRQRLETRQIFVYFKMHTQVVYIARSRLKYLLFVSMFVLSPATSVSKSSIV